MDSLKYLSLLDVFNSFTFNEQEKIISDLIEKAGIITLDNIDYLDESKKKIAKFIFRITQTNKTTKVDVNKVLEMLNYLFDLATEGQINHTINHLCEQNDKRQKNNKRQGKNNLPICCSEYTISRGRDKNYFKLFDDEVSKEIFFDSMLINAKCFNIIMGNKKVNFKNLLNNRFAKLEQSEWHIDYPINNIIYKVNDLILQNSHLQIFIQHHLNYYYVKNNYIHNDVKNNSHNVTMNDIIEENTILKNISSDQLGIDFNESTTEELIELTVNRDE